MKNKFTYGDIVYFVFRGQPDYNYRYKIVDVIECYSQELKSIQYYTYEIMNLKTGKTIKERWYPNTDECFISAENGMTKATRRANNDNKKA